MFFQNKKGLFITFEGIEGCGKTTQIKHLVAYLEKQQQNVLLTREPGGTTISEKIRSLLLDPQNTNMTALTELFLYSASRIQHLQEKIIPHLQQDYIVISDRFYDSTTAYQGAGRVIPSEIVQQINQIAIQNSIPDITFFIDVPVEIGLRRALKRQNGYLDRLEAETKDFHERVRQAYLKIMKQESNRFVQIDGTRSEVEVHHQICEILNDQFFQK